MEELYFKVEGEFICDLARTMFWDDDRPYEACEELLLSCLGTDEISLDEKKGIAQDILEGKKKLIGINCFDLVDDNENVRPITNKIKQLQDKLQLKRIKEHMELNPLLYVDPYSTVKSLRAAREYKQISTYKEAYRYFCFSEFDFDDSNEFPEYRSETMCGLWLLHEPELVLKVNGGPCSYYDDRNLFWKEIYEAVKERKGSFAARNERYLGSVRVEENKREEKIRNEEEAMAKGKEAVKVIEAEIETDYEKHINAMSYREYAAHLKEMDPMNIEYDVRPDNIKNFEGLIDLEENFYSCSFGGHNIKAYHILVTYWDKFDFKKLIGKDIKSRREANHVLKMDTALDVIIDAGWIATRYLPYRGSYLSYKDDILFKATKAQKDTIWEDLTKHEVKLSDYSLIL